MINFQRSHPQFEGVYGMRETVYFVGFASFGTGKIKAIISI
jgi:hypothetical protein